MNRSLTAFAFLAVAAAGVAVGFLLSRQSEPPGPPPEAPLTRAEPPADSGRIIRDSPARPPRPVAAAELPPPPVPVRSDPPRPPQPVAPPPTPQPVDIATPAKAADAPPAAADRHRVYRWTNAEGQVEFGDDEFAPKHATAVPIETEANQIEPPPIAAYQPGGPPRPAPQAGPADEGGMADLQRQLCAQLRQQIGSSSARELEERFGPLLGTCPP